MMYNAFVWTVLLAVLVASNAWGQLELTAKPDRIEIASADQKIVFAPRAAREKGLAISTFVRDGQQWQPLFDAALPIVQGSLFDLVPTSHRVIADTAARKAVVFRGTRSDASAKYNWEMLVEATADSPLIHFVITLDLDNALTLPGPQPNIALGMNKAAELVIDQGPTTIYGKLGIPSGYGFPAAYLWNDGNEAVIFFNMTPMTWFSPAGVFRFLDVRVGSHVQDGKTSFGLHTDKLTGSTIPAGKMVIDYSLYAGPRKQKPSKLQALDTMVQVCAPLHPATSVFPRNNLENSEVSWTYFAGRAIKDLMIPGQTCATQPAGWQDSPLKLVPDVKEMLTHGGGLGGTDGDFSCINNHLTPWMLFARMYDDTEKLRAARMKTDALPLFFDPKATMIRYGSRVPPRVGDMEMSWQNFFYYVETARAGLAAGPDSFNPAIAGRYLMALKGLGELGHNVQYVFPQWFNPYEKQAIVQNDVKQLGTVREPWQAGTYAYAMFTGHEMTGDQHYLDEAKAAVETLLTKMQYTETNDVYTRTYTDPVDFPVTELFGNAYGIAAAQKVFEKTGEQKFNDYSRAFLNTLLRLTFWYEDDADPICRELHSAGLFYPHAGAANSCPWETSEAYLGIIWALKHDVDKPIENLLLKLSNLNRINSFYYYPAAYSEKVAALDPQRRKDAGQFWPIEPLYTFEGSGGQRGPTAAYMSNNAMWNWWMYEALAEADNREVMVVNLDVLEDYEQAIRAAERHLMAFNPTDKPLSIKLRSKSLPAGKYEVKIGETVQSYDAAQLTDGIPLTLKPMESARVTIRHEKAAEMLAEIDACRKAQNALSHAYQLLQQQTWESGKGVEFARRFDAAMKQYEQRQYDVAAKLAGQIVSDALPKQ